MAQGQFTKEEAREMRKTVDEIMSAFSKKQFLNYVGHFNDLLLFLSAAEAAAPNEKGGD